MADEAGAWNGPDEGKKKTEIPSPSHHPRILSIRPRSARRHPAFLVGRMDLANNFTILRLHHSTHTRLRSGGLYLLLRAPARTFVPPRRTAVQVVGGRGGIFSTAGVIAKIGYVRRSEITNRRQWWGSGESIGRSKGRAPRAKGLGAQPELSAPPDQARVSAFGAVLPGEMFFASLMTRT